MLAVAGLVLLLVVGIADAGLILAGRHRAAAAADAAALAAAPVTFRPFGAAGTPTQEAARFAAMNGASIVTCRCSADGSWRARTVPEAIPSKSPGLSTRHWVASVSSSSRHGAHQSA